MNKKGILVGIMIGLALLSVAAIIITVVLTGGKDIGEFDQRENTIFIGMIVSVIAIWAVVFVLADKVGKINRDENPALQKPVKVTKQESRLLRRSMTMWITAIIITIAAFFCGVTLAKNFDIPQNGFIYGLALTSFFALPVFFLFNYFLRMIYVKRINNFSVAKMQNLIISQRELSEEMRMKKLKFLKRWRKLMYVYSAAVVFFGAAFAFCLGALHLTKMPYMLIFSAVFIMLGFSRIRFDIPNAFMDEDEKYVSKEDYPYLYKIAEKAQKTVLDNERPLKICLLGDDNIGIGEFSDTYSLQLGIQLLSVLSEDELYCILLHEFSHIKNSLASLDKSERKYANWLVDGRANNIWRKASDSMYGFFDAVYGFNFMLYDYATSISVEFAADKEMLRCGDKKTVASALVKTFYCRMFDWEDTNRDFDPFYANEECPKDTATRQVNKFKELIASRGEEWNKFIRKQILSHGDSHPTMDMRLSALGITEYETVPDDKSTAEYNGEKEKALGFIDRLIYESNKDEYGETRNNIYFKELKILEDWENAGKPLTADGFRDVVEAFAHTGRMSAAESICDEVIANLPDFSAAFAIFFKGLCLLHRYDDEGIEYVYKALELNQNYIDEGMDARGQYSCITGNQKELDQYREKVLVLAQKQKDVYSQIGMIAKNDDLSAENLPDGMLEEIMSFIGSVSENTLEKVYLVRKTVSESDFTSAFILKFEDGTPVEKQQEVYNKIFNHLDTVSDWQYSLFTYPDVANAHVERIEGSCVFSKGE